MEQLLTTKLYIPHTRPELVSRPRLIDLLNQGLHRKLTLISAPAGFGKTTLVTEWLDCLQVDDRKANQFEIRIAWLSIDEGDNDLFRFLAYFITALKQTEKVNPSFGKSALDMLQFSQPPATEIILTALINEIATIPDRIILVLDDYHLIETQQIYDVITLLLENLPPQMHLVIATREDPLLPLSRLRARGQLTELRAADLRFSAPEATEFLNQVMNLELSMEEIASLEMRTEGWITGLQMAALSMQRRKDTSSFIQAFTGSHHYVLDYLVEEVLQQQTEKVRSFLLQTSLLKRLNGDLCNAITGQEDGKHMLEALHRDNLFVIPLDDQRHWYRYHHLFADVLHDHLVEQQPNQVINLHRRASEWYEQNDLPSEAISHALAAQDFKRAAALAELAWPAWSGSYQSITWLSWIKNLPIELIRVRPVLSVNCAWAHLNAGELEAAETRILDAERLLEPASDAGEGGEIQPSEMVVVDDEQFQSLPVSLATARAYHAQAVGDSSNTALYARRVLDLLPEGDHPRRGDAYALLGLAHWASGDLEAAYLSLSTGLADMEPLAIIVGAFVLSDIKMTIGHLQEAVQICEHALCLASEQGEPTPLGTEDVYSAISHLHRERGDLEGAAQDLATGKKLGDQVELPDWQYRWCIAQARLNETLGDLDGALELLDEAERVFVRTPLPDIRPIPAMKARVWIRQGQIMKALSWARERGLSFDNELSYLHEFEHITLARMLIIHYKSERADDSHQKAVKLLERLLSTAEEGGRYSSVIEILVLQALALEAQDDIPLALKPLERALKMAELEGYVQIFVDEGPPMARLLYEALSRGIAPDYVQRLLGAFPDSGPEQVISVQTQAPKSEMIEPLSEREIEVLQLISEGLTNQEIATKLYLSLHTVKVHARNIYGKLGVRNRAQAVAKGKALGILPSN